MDYSLKYWLSKVELWFYIIRRFKLLFLNTIVYDIIIPYDAKREIYSKWSLTMSIICLFLLHLCLILNIIEVFNYDFVSPLSKYNVYRDKKTGKFFKVIEIKED